MFSLRGLRLYFPELEPWFAWSASLPTVHLVYLCVSVGPRSTTHRSACPVLCHSESRPSQFICVRIWDRRVWSWSDCLPRLSHTPPVSVLPGHRSPLRPSAHLHPSYRSGCMSLFYLLDVRLPCRWFFCQFWLCEEAQCVYLRHHLGSLSNYLI